MTTELKAQLTHDIEQAVIAYLGIEVIEHDGQPWEYIHKGIKHTCVVGERLDWVIDDMYDSAGWVDEPKYLITAEELMACNALIALETAGYEYSYPTQKDEALKLALEIMPKHIRDNLMLSLTLYKLAKGEDGDFPSFLEYNIYQELEITKALFHRLYGFQELTDFDMITDDESVDRLIRLTFPGIPLASVLDVEEDEDMEDVPEDESENQYKWLSKKMKERIAFEKFIPEVIKESGHSYLKIWEYLRDNQEQWFTANQLAEQFNCTPQWIRDAVGIMRKQGIDIFGHTRKGYILRTSVVSQLFSDG